MEKTTEQEQLNRARKEAGRKIDPQTAEVCWHYAYCIDPYGDRDEKEIEGIEESEGVAITIGREYFAGTPGSDIWGGPKICRKTRSARYGDAWRRRRKDEHYDHGSKRGRTARNHPHKDDLRTTAAIVFPVRKKDRPLR
jgi:hypothetical protein